MGSPTQINTWLKFAKEHITETTSDLQMLARDLKNLAENPEALDAGGIIKEDILLLVKLVSTMEDQSSKISTMLIRHLGHIKWPEVNHQKQNKRESLQQ